MLIESIGVSFIPLPPFLHRRAPCAIIKAQKAIVSVCVSLASAMAANVISKNNQVISEQLAVFLENR